MCFRAEFQIRKGGKEGIRYVKYLLVNASVHYVILRARATLIKGGRKSLSVVVMLLGVPAIIIIGTSVRHGPSRV